jgi:signal transduction histidine kinase
MLDEFIVTNREAIIASTQTRISSTHGPKPTQAELLNGVPAFLDQLGDALRRAKSTSVVDHRELDESAVQNGLALLRKGLSLRQLVHVYGDVCQSITELAMTQGAPLATEEFHTLNLCLDDATAEAVTAYCSRRAKDVAAQGTERLGAIAHEMRNLLNTAVISFDLIRSGRVTAAGSTGMVHMRSLMGLRSLLDLSLADVRLDAECNRAERISVGELIEEEEAGARLQAQARGLDFAVTPIEGDVTIEGDRPILAAAVSNLLQNAFKFTHEHGHVSLTTRLTTDRVMIDVEDECGGLPPGKAKDLFQQPAKGHSAIGQGPSICLKAAKANAGEVRVRDIPGRGCVFTLDLPRVRAAVPRLS